MFQTGPMRSINPAPSPAAVLIGKPFHSDDSGLATSTFTRLATASVLAIRSLMRVLALVPPAVLLETCMEAAPGQPHIHRHIIDDKRDDVRNDRGAHLRCRVGCPMVNREAVPGNHGGDGEGAGRRAIWRSKP
jgi:hypothetical protein